MFAQPLVPVIVLDDATLAEPLAEALLNGGLRVMEITFRTTAAEAAIRCIAKKFPDIFIGAGTVLNATHVQRARDAGAQFFVSPGLHPATVAAARETGLPILPGVCTPTEVEAALALNCTVLKFFPAEAAGGVKMLKALAGPYAHTGVKFCPTGGITADNMRDYLRLPIVAAVGGSWMVDSKLINARRFDDITRLTKEALASIDNHRQQST